MTAARFTKQLAVAALLFFATACANTMSNYYKAVGTAGVLVSTGYRLLDANDAAAQTTITAQAVTDPAGATAALAAYLKKYNLARNALTIAATTVEDANAAAPVIAAATNKDTQIADWLLKLGTLAADVISSLQPLGITVNVAGINVTAAASSIAGATGSPGAVTP